MQLGLGRGRILKQVETCKRFIECPFHWHSLLVFSIVFFQSSVMPLTFVMNEGGFAVRGGCGILPRSTCSSDDLMVYTLRPASRMAGDLWSRI